MHESRIDRGISGRQTVVVWATEFRGKVYEYIETRSGRKASLPEYVEGILERERRKDRIEQRKQHRLNGYNNGNGNGSPR